MKNKSRVYWIKVKDASIKNIDGKESNTAKGVNVTTELLNSKTFCSTKKS